MKKVVLKDLATNSIKDFKLNKKLIIDTALFPDKKDEYGELKILVKHAKKFSYLLTAKELNNIIEILSAVKIKKSFLKDFINPLIVRSINGEDTNNLSDLTPTQIKELFLEVFARPIVIGDVGPKKFFIDQERKILVEGILDIQKYKEWIKK